MGYRERNQKKSLIALAVLAASGSAFAATSNVDVYGVIGQEITSVDAKATYMGFTASADTTTVGDSLNNGSRLGFKGSEDLGGGMSAIWQIESAIGTDATQSIGGRNTFVGLKGAFGTVIVGRHDTPEKLSTGANDVFADTTADYNSMIVDTRENDVVAYISPDFNGFHAAVAGVAGETTTNDGLADGLSAALIYKNGPLGASYARTTAEQNLALNAGAATAYTDNGDLTTDRVGVNYTMGDLFVAATYQKVKEDNGADSKAWVAAAAYNMGPVTMKAQYGDFDDKTSTNADATQWTVGADYNLSKRTKLYVLHTDAEVKVSGVDLDVTATTVGVRHSF